jgi:hypothetical protein
MSAEVQVMAWEILVGGKFYGPAPDFAFVVKVLLGGGALPCDAPQQPGAAKHMLLPALAESLRAMLQRDPAQRPPLSQVLPIWEAVLADLQRS